MPSTLTKEVEKLMEEKSLLQSRLRTIEKALGEKLRGTRIIKGAKRGSRSRPRPSPLDAIKEVMDATEDLRTPGGNISAERIAALYGVSLSQLAGWLGKSRQTVTKTPDAASLQGPLAYFERVARLRMAVKSDETFRKWLRIRSELLDDESPLDLMARGEWQVMADYVDDMLTGAPT